jgi:glycerophosphoryl diester phosphodiesterase
MVGQADLASPGSTPSFFRWITRSVWWFFPRVCFLSLLLLVSCGNDDQFKKRQIAHNLGHKGGGGKGEYFFELPENSLTAIRASLQGWNGLPATQLDSRFHYLDLDIAETFDGQIILFHDAVLSKRMPLDLPENREALSRLSRSGEVLDRLAWRNPEALTGRADEPIDYKKLRVLDLSVAELKQFYMMAPGYPQYAEPLTTLDEAFDFIDTVSMRRSIMFDMKHVRTLAAMEKAMERASLSATLMDDIEISARRVNFPVDRVGFFMGPAGRFMFPNQTKLKAFCALLEKYGYGDFYGYGDYHGTGHCETGRVVFEEKYRK